MNVHGYEVPKDVEDAALNAMVGEFSARDIERAAIEAGAPEVINVGLSHEYCAHRIADRLLQREKKKGRISLKGRKWVANAQAQPTAKASEASCSGSAGAKS